MNLVVDASAVVEVLLGSPSGGRLAAELLAADHSLHAPQLLDAEVGHTLRKGWLGGQLTAERARQALADLADLPLERHDHLLLLSRAWAFRDTATFHDGLYLALAWSLGAPLVTCDARLARAPALGIPVLLR